MDVKSIQNKIEPPSRSAGKPTEDPMETFKRVRLARPIPGQSLTQDPEKPLPFERPPEFTSIEKAQTYLFEKLMSTSSEIVSMLSQGIPVETIVNLAVVTGFQQGKWLPDLMLLLIEPAYYIVLFIAEVGGVDYVFSDDEEDYMDADQQLRADSTIRKQMSRIGTVVQKEVQEEGLQAAATEVLPPSLLSRVGELNG